MFAYRVKCTFVSSFGLKASVRLDFSRAVDTSSVHLASDRISPGCCTQRSIRPDDKLSWHLRVYYGMLCVSWMLLTGEFGSSTEGTRPRLPPRCDLNRIRANPIRIQLPAFRRLPSNGAGFVHDWDACWKWRPRWEWWVQVTLGWPGYAL